MLEVIPIASTTIDWKTLLTVTNTVLGRSITQGSDAKNLSVGDLASYIRSLGEFEYENSDPTTTLREAGSLLRHAYFSFLCLSSRTTIQEIGLISGLNVLLSEADDCGIFSGNLEQWRTAIINGCTPRVSKIVRLFFDKCLNHFEQIGLGTIWSNYVKVVLKDTTFQLESKI